MKRIKWIFVLALPLLIALSLLAVKTIRTVKQENLMQKISNLENEASTLRKEEKLVEALDKLEQLQVLLMNAGKYQDALITSFTMEEWSRTASDRKSPWDCVRIAEAYLGLGDRERYLDWMEKAVNERSFLKLDYFQDERLGAFKDDPRYKKIVAVGLRSYALISFGLAQGV